MSFVIRSAFGPPPLSLIKIRSQKWKNRLRNKFEHLKVQWSVGNTYDPIHKQSWNENISLNQWPSEGQRVLRKIKMGGREGVNLQTQFDDIGVTIGNDYRFGTWGCVVQHGTVIYKPHAFRRFCHLSFSFVSAHTTLALPPPHPKYKPLSIIVWRCAHNRWIRSFPSNQYLTLKKTKQKNVKAKLQTWPYYRIGISSIVKKLQTVYLRSSYSPQRGLMGAHYSSKCSRGIRTNTWIWVSFSFFMSSSA